MSIKFKTNLNSNFDTSGPVEITTAGGKTVTAYPVGYSSVPTTPITFKKPSVDVSAPVDITRADGKTVTAYPEGMLPSPSKTEKPVYSSPYSGRVTELLDAISGYKPFSYDMEADPLYKQYRKQYLREGKRAVEDTMGSFAGMTGGIPSSYAVTAAAQAGNYYNSQLNDRIPELYQLAYDRYRNDYDKLFDELNMYMTADDIAYGRHRDDVSDWYDERQYNRDVFENDRDFQYKANVYSDEKAASDEAAAWEKAGIAADYGDYSYLETLGVDMSRYKADETYAKAVETALLKAKYDDFSGLEALGIDTTALRAAMAASSDTGSTSDGSSGTSNYYGVLPEPKNEEVSKVASGTVGNGVYGALPEPVSGAETTPSDGTIKQPSAWTTAVLQNMQYGSDNYIAIIESLKNSGISDLDKASYIYSLTQNGLPDELAMRMFTDIGLNISDYTD